MPGWERLLSVEDPHELRLTQALLEDAVRARQADRNERLGTHRQVIAAGVSDAFNG